MKGVTVLLADDHKVVAEGLARLLRECVELVGVAADGEQLVSCARRHRPQIIVTDVSMPKMTGLDALRQLKAEGNDARFLFLTMHPDPALAGQALRGGALGYLLKQSAGEELLKAIREVAAGRLYLSPLIAGDVIALLSGPAAPADRLTPRQRDVLRLVVKGHTMKQVAAALDLSPRTVESHKYEMMQSLGVQTTAELIAYAFRHGLTADVMN